MLVAQSLLVCSLFTAILLASSGVAGGATVIALRVQGCSLGEINDIYYCVRPNECHSSSRQFQISRVSILKGDATQGVRYIGRLETGGASRKWLFGALEVSSEPLSTKTWKQLATNSSEVLMSVKEVVISKEQGAEGAGAGDGEGEGDLEASIRTFSAVRELNYLRRELGLPRRTLELSQSWSALERSCLKHNSALCVMAQCDYLVERESYNLAGDCYQRTTLLQSNSSGPTECWLAHLDIVERAAIITLFRLFDARSFKSMIENSLSEDCVKLLPAAARRLTALMSLGQMLLGHYQEMQGSIGVDRGPSPVFPSSVTLASFSESGQLVTVESLIFSCVRSRSIVRHAQISVLLDHVEVLLRQSQQNALPLQLDWEFSSAIISSFLAVGASHLAVHHFVSVTSAVPLPKDASHRICAECSSCRRRGLNVGALSCLSVRWFQALSQDEAFQYLSHDSVASMFLRLIVEVANPVVLESPYQNWMEEVHFLKAESGRLLTSVGDECRRIHCLWPHNLMASVGRGLFMQAYQGGQLLWPILRSDDLLDWKAGSMILDMSRGSGANSPVLSSSQFPTDPLQEGRLRVAFIAFSFTRHSVGRLLVKLLCSLHAYDIDVVIVTDRGCGSSASLDDLSMQLQSCITPANFICFTASSSPVELEGKLAQLGVGAIVYSDLAMQPPLLEWVHNIRLAPIQVVFWGHPFTTSDFNGIDYFITSTGFEPEAVSLARDVHFSEQLVQFDSLSFALADPEPIEQPFANEADVRAEPRDTIFQWLCDHGITLQGEPYSCSYIEDLQLNCSREGDSVKLYGVLQSMMKLHPAFDLAILRILQLDPCGIVVITRNDAQWEWLRRLQYRLASTLENAAGRVIMVGQVPHRTYASVLCKLHVSVDPFPFGGGVTLCDALACGCGGSMAGGNRFEESGYPTPFVSVGDVQTVHRIGSGILSAVDDADLGSIIHCPEVARVGQPRDQEMQELAQYNEIFNIALGNCTERLATQALKLARMARTRKLDSHREELQSKCSKTDILFSAEAISKEWSRFLHRAWRSVATKNP